MSTLKRVLLVVNPGSRRGFRRRGVALRAFSEAGVSVDEVITTHAGHAREVLAARKEHWDAVFVLGGDGAVMEVVGAMAHSGIPIGVLPGGTGNLVAGVLGVPLGIGRAVKVLLAGDRCPFDLGQLPDGRYFTFAAGVGVDVAMVEKTPFGRKRALGILSYAITASRAALGRDPVHVTIDVDGKRVEAKAILAMVANAGAILGGRFSLGPNVVPDDGELDLCVFMPDRTREVFGLIWRMLRKDFRPHPRMTFARGKRFVISTEPSVSIQADGDIIGRTPIEISVAPRAAVFLRPRS
jgi:YegS/Rv2252/BmrU family lipid kinase